MPLEAYLRPLTDVVRMNLEAIISCGDCRSCCACTVKKQTWRQLRAAIISAGPMAHHTYGGFSKCAHFLRASRARFGLTRPVDCLYLKKYSVAAKTKTISMISALKLVDLAACGIPFSSLSANQSGSMRECDARRKCARARIMRAFTEPSISMVWAWHRRLPRSSQPSLDDWTQLVGRAAAAATNTGASTATSAHLPNGARLASGEACPVRAAGTISGGPQQRRWLLLLLLPRRRTCACRSKHKAVGLVHQRQDLVHLLFVLHTQQGTV